MCGQLRSIATRSNPPSTPHNCPRAKLGLGNYAQSESLSPPFCNLEFKRNAASCCCFSMAIWAILVIVDDEISDRHNETLPPPYFVNYLSFKTLFCKLTINSFQRGDDIAMQRTSQSTNLKSQCNETCHRCKGLGG